jgi:hypothetical protein
MRTNALLARRPHPAVLAPLAYAWRQQQERDGVGEAALLFMEVRPRWQGTQRAAGFVTRLTCFLVYRCRQAMEASLDGYLTHRSTAVPFRPWGVSDLPSLLRALVAVAGGLEHLHELGVSHLDVKASNVLLSGGLGVVKVADFDLAKLDALHTLAQYSTTTLEDLRRSDLGRYSFPESVGALGRGRRELTPKADVWQLGILLLHVFALQDPDAKRVITKDTVTAAVAAGAALLTPTQIAALLNSGTTSSSVTTQLLEVVGQCLRLDPESRPPMAAVRQLLENVALSHPNVVVLGVSASIPGPQHITLVEVPSPTRLGSVAEEVGRAAAHPLSLPPTIALARELQMCLDDARRVYDRALAPLLASCTLEQALDVVDATVRPLCRNIVDKVASHLKAALQLERALGSAGIVATSANLNSLLDDAQAYLRLGLGGMPLELIHVWTSLHLIRKLGNIYSHPGGTTAQERLAKSAWVADNQLKGVHEYVAGEGAPRPEDVSKVLHAVLRATRDAVLSLVEPAGSGSVASIVSKVRRSPSKLEHTGGWLSWSLPCRAGIRIPPAG